MSFWCLQFFQKMNLKIQIFALAYWKNWINPKCLFEINWPLPGGMLKLKISLNGTPFSYKTQTNPTCICCDNQHNLITRYINWNRILLPKLFWPTVRKKCPTFEIRGWRPRICKIFEITRTIYSNSERSEQFLVTECFFNLFLRPNKLEQLEFKLEKFIGI